MQTCIFHLLRASTAFASYKDRKVIATALRAVYKAVDADAALRELEARTALWRLVTQP